MAEGQQAETIGVWSADAAAAAPLVAALGLVDPLEALPEAPPETGRLLLLHLTPAAALARRLAAGQGPEAALSAWEEDLRALLALHRAARRQVRLAELSAALADPGGLAAALGLEPPAEPVSEPEKGDPVLTLLAQRLILGHAPARALAAELEAASADLSGGTGLAADDPDAAWRAHAGLLEAGTEAGLLRAQTRAQQEELAVRARAADRAGQEVELLKAQNGAMMAELEALAKGRQQAEARLAQQAQGLDSFAAQVAALEVEREAQRARLAGKEQSLLEAGQMLEERDTRLQGLVEELAALRSESANARTGAVAREAALGADLAAERQRVAALQAEIERITASRSFRLTAPLRRMRALIGGRS